MDIFQNLPNIKSKTLKKKFCNISLSLFFACMIITQNFYPVIALNRTEILASGFCGDGTCDSTEIYSCPPDCPNFCGNGTCDSGETSATCSADCGLPPAYFCDGQNTNVAMCNPPFTFCDSAAVVAMAGSCSYNCTLICTSEGHLGGIETGVCTSPNLPSTQYSACCCVPISTTSSSSSTSGSNSTSTTSSSTSGSNSTSTTSSSTSGTPCDPTQNGEDGGSNEACAGAGLGAQSCEVCVPSLSSSGICQDRPSGECCSCCHPPEEISGEPNTGARILNSNEFSKEIKKGVAKEIQKAFTSEYIKIKKIKKGKLSKSREYTVVNKIEVTLDEIKIPRIKEAGIEEVSIDKDKNIVSARVSRNGMTSWIKYQLATCSTGESCSKAATRQANETGALLGINNACPYCNYCDTDPTFGPSSDMGRCVASPCETGACMNIPSTGAVAMCAAMTNLRPGFSPGLCACEICGNDSDCSHVDDPSMCLMGVCLSNMTCSTASICPADRPLCDNGNCVECTNDTECMGRIFNGDPVPYCSMNQCTRCVNDDQCKDPANCKFDAYCQTMGGDGRHSCQNTIVSCGVTMPYRTRPFCSAGDCHKCRDSMDCTRATSGIDLPPCNEYSCMDIGNGYKECDFMTVAFTCNPTLQIAGIPTTARYCDAASGMCFECTDMTGMVTSQCSDLNNCKGAVCLDSGACASSLAFLPLLCGMDNRPQAGNFTTLPYCLMDGNGSCVQCLNDMHCRPAFNDDTICTLGVCNLMTNTCEEGTVTECMTPTPGCNGMGTCVQCSADSHCSTNANPQPAGTSPLNLTDCKRKFCSLPDRPVGNGGSFTCTTVDTLYCGVQNNADLETNPMGTLEPPYCRIPPPMGIANGQCVDCNDGRDCPAADTQYDRFCWGKCTRNPNLTPSNPAMPACTAMLTFYCDSDEICYESQCTKGECYNNTISTPLTNASVNLNPFFDAIMTAKTCCETECMSTKLTLGERQACLAECVTYPLLGYGIMLNLTSSQQAFGGVKTYAIGTMFTYPAFTPTIFPPGYKAFFPAGATVIYHGAMLTPAKIFPPPGTGSVGWPLTGFLWYPPQLPYPSGMTTVYLPGTAVYYPSGAALTYLNPTTITIPTPVTINHPGVYNNVRKCVELACMATTRPPPASAVGMATWKRLNWNLCDMVGSIVTIPGTNVMIMITDAGAGVYDVGVKCSEYYGNITVGL